MSGHDRNDNKGRWDSLRRHDDGDIALVYWRMLPVNRMESEAKENVLACIKRITATSDDWRRAIRGDAASAVSLALRLETPSMVSYRVDLVMTLLLRAAIDDAAAATVTAHRLNAMPLNFKTRSKLATSWLLHCIWHESRRQRRARRRSPPKTRPRSNGNDLQ